jgi:hypothetical protein
MTYSKQDKQLFLKAGEEITITIQAEPVLTSYQGKPIYLIGTIIRKHVYPDRVFDGRKWALCSGAWCKHCLKYKHQPITEVCDIPVRKWQNNGRYDDEWLVMPIHAYFGLSALFKELIDAGLKCAGLKVRLKRIPHKPWEIEVLERPTEKREASPPKMLILDNKEIEDLLRLQREVSKLDLAKLPTKEEFVQVLVESEYAWKAERAKEVIDAIYHAGKLEVKQRLVLN